MKDQVIGVMEKDPERLIGEREGYVGKLMAQSHRIGELEARLLQLGAPAECQDDSESFMIAQVDETLKHDAETPRDSD